MNKYVVSMEIYQHYYVCGRKLGNSYITKAAFECMVMCKDFIVMPMAGRLRQFKLINPHVTMQADKFMAKCLDFHRNATGWEVASAGDTATVQQFKIINPHVTMQAFECMGKCKDFHSHPTGWDPTSAGDAATVRQFKLINFHLTMDAFECMAMCRLHSHTTGWEATGAGDTATVRQCDSSN